MVTSSKADYVIIINKMVRYFYNLNNRTMISCNTSTFLHINLGLSGFTKLFKTDRFALGDVIEDDVTSSYSVMGDAERKILQKGFRNNVIKLNLYKRTGI